MSLLDQPGSVDDGTDALEPLAVEVGDESFDAPLPPRRDDRVLRQAIDVVVVAACSLFVFWQLHPALLLADTTPAGGDMGAHVWAFGYLRDVLLPSGRLSGWTPDWYAGFPVFQFYMVVPFLGMVLLNAGLTGVSAIVPGLASLAMSARAAGARRLRPAAAGLGAIAVVALLGGVWSGYAAGFRFVLGTVAISAAVVAGRIGTGSHRWWWAAGAIGLATVGIGLPYGTSFKLVSVAGVVAMPVAAFLFGRLSRLPYPTPALLSVATLGFLFDTNFTIYGGNIASTMAGEFAFSISLALAIAYLGVLVHGLRTGTHRATAAVLLALVGLCHLIPAFFALAATAVLLVIHIAAETEVRRIRVGADVTALAAAGGVLVVGIVANILEFATVGPIIAWAVVAMAMIAVVWWSQARPGRERSDAEQAAAAQTVDEPLPDAPVPVPPVPVAPTADVQDAVPGWFGSARVRWLAAVGVVSALLAAWWVLPFYARTTYLNDMGWEKIAVHREGAAIWAWFVDEVWSLLIPSDLRIVAALALVGAVLAVGFRSRVGSALVILGLGLALAFVYAPQGRLWNARLLPFWYLVVYFLAALGVGEVVRALAQVFAKRTDRPVRAYGWAAAPVVFVLVATFLGGQLHNLPGGRDNADGSYRLFSSIGIPGAFSYDLPDIVGIDVRGRNFVTDWSRWNYSGYERKDAYPEYRSIVATMDDVGRTRGCGMSLWEYSPDLNDYGTPMALMLLPHWTDGCIGSMEGLYFEASSTTPFHFLMQSELSASPSRAQRDLPYRELDIDAGVDHLQLMGVRYYLARSAEAVTAASAHPDLTEVSASGPWVVYEVSDAPMVEALAFEPAVTTNDEDQGGWLCDEKVNDRCTGPALDWFQDSSQWPVALAASGPEGWQRVGPDERPERRPVTPAVVDDVEVGRDGISFTVDRPGTPVLVKQSYFPNWEVSGAEGPYRVAPNLMLVVPTDTEVSLTFGRTGVDLLALALTLLGIAAVAFLVRAGGIDLPRLRDAESPLVPEDD